MTEIERLLAENACQRLCVDYAHFGDSGQPEALAALFAEDGEVKLPTGTSKGRAAIAAGATPTPNLVMRHVMSNIRIDVESADKASGVAYLRLYYAMRKGDTGPAVTRALAPRLVGAYHDRFVRTAEGWRFASRDFEIALMPSVDEAAT
ncbi:MAG TPA: nuclear transport factor 2 family protein [Caulobacteraceae bacterium]|jgi:hypothetical protein|nr:nuclear transport factor 2 family protein [Caulobacteraceae bacterium]